MRLVAFDFFNSNNYLKKDDMYCTRTKRDQCRGTKTVQSDPDGILSAQCLQLASLTRSAYLASSSDCCQVNGGQP